MPTPNFYVAFLTYIHIFNFKNICFISFKASVVFT